MMLYSKKLLDQTKEFLNTHTVPGFDRSVCKATDDDARQYLDANPPKKAQEIISVTPTELDLLKMLRSRDFEQIRTEIVRMEQAENAEERVLEITEKEVKKIVAHARKNALEVIKANCTVDEDAIQDFMSDCLPVNYGNMTDDAQTKAWEAVYQGIADAELVVQKALKGVK